MRFNSLFIATAVLSVGQLSAASLVDTIVDNIDAVTKASNDTAQIAQQITTPISIFQYAPSLLRDFSGIADSVLSDIKMMNTAPKDTKFATSDQSRICDAFTDFVKVHQALLSIVIGRGGLITQTAFGAPVAAVLRLLERGVDTLAFSIIGLVPTCEKKAKAELKNLDNSLEEAISVYTPKPPNTPGVFGGFAQ